MIRRLAPAVLCLLAGCNSPAPRTESTADTCANGRDDDGDGLIDCSDPACGLFTFCAVRDAGIADAPLDSPPFDGDAPGCRRGIDVVLVLDVSSSMPDDLMRIRAAVPALVARARELDPTATIGVVLFVDDVFLVNDCASFASADDVVAQIDARIAAAPMNLNLLPEHAFENRDCAENALDAIFDAASTCPFRPLAEHTIVLVTDDTFAERPAVLSGEWGGGVFVETTYAEAVTALTGHDVRLVAVTQSATGDACGAGTSPDVGRGYFTPYMDMTTLPEATGGTAIDLRDVRSGAVDLATALPALLCAP